MTEHEDHRRPPIEDPDFLKSLSDLDRGLAGGEADEISLADALGLPPPAPPATAGGRQQEAPAATPPPPAPPPRRPETGAGGRRPLLDLFPPAPAAPDSAVADQPAAASPLSAGFVDASDTFYGFDEKPFGPSVDPKFFYHGESHDAAAQEFLSAVRAPSGAVLITGPAGIGKTLLCRTVIEELDRRTLTSLVLDPTLAIEDLLRTLLSDFGVISREDLARGTLRVASIAELSAALREFLKSLAALQASAVVILDNAQELAPGVLKEIARWSDEDNDLRLLQVVLVGRTEFARRLRKRDVRALDRRIGVRITIGPIQPDEVGGYLAHRIAAAGPRPRVEFDEGAQVAIHRLTRGVPGDINLLCDRALARGHAASAGVIDATMVEEAADEIGLAPPETLSRRIARRAVVAIVLVLLALVGAAAAALVFREPFGRLVERWGPIAPLAAPLTPGPPAQGPPAP